MIVARTIEILVKSTRFYPYFEYLPCYVYNSELFNTCSYYLHMNSTVACCYRYSTPAPVKWQVMKNSALHIIWQQNSNAANTYHIQVASYSTEMRTYRCLSFYQ